MMASERREVGEARGGMGVSVGDPVEEEEDDDDPVIKTIDVFLSQSEASSKMYVKPS